MARRDPSHGMKTKTNDIPACNAQADCLIAGEKRQYVHHEYFANIALKPESDFWALEDQRSIKSAADGGFWHVAVLEGSQKR